MIINPNEVDQEMNVETYAYGPRAAVPVALRSNIQTVIDPTLSEAEQMARNRERCNGMFGNFAETSENIPMMKQKDGGWDSKRRVIMYA